MPSLVFTDVSLVENVCSFEADYTRLFKLYMFRTMLNPKDGVVGPKQDKDRLTPFECKLNSTSHDELPELINILKGEMSIVGS